MSSATTLVHRQSDELLAMFGNIFAENANAVQLDIHCQRLTCDTNAHVTLLTTNAPHKPWNHG